MILPGDSVTVDAQLLVGGALVDPSSIVVRVTAPSGAVTVYTYGSSSELVRIALGSYALTFVPDAGGEWKYEWTTDGSVNAELGGSVQVASAVALLTTDGVGPVSLCSVSVRTSAGVVVAEAVTDSDGEAVVMLAAGIYRVLGEKAGWRFSEFLFEADGGVGTCTVVATRLALSWLALSDLEAAGGADTVAQLFADAKTGTVEPGRLQRAMQMAEAYAESLLLKAWPRAAIPALAREDEAVRFHAAWLALEFASETRAEFLASDGKGRFWAQYERATSYLSGMAKAQLASRAASAQGGPGPSAQSGGARRPRVTRQGGGFIFADEDGKSHGGF